MKVRGGVDGLSEDHADALDALFREHAESLYRRARFFGLDHVGAEDTVQDAFIRLGRSLHRIGDSDKRGAYLRRIVHNLCHDYNRRGLMSLRHRPPPDPEPAPLEEDVIGRYEATRVREAVNRLPRRQRDCIYLCYFDRLTYDQIAKTLVISQNSVKKHLERARKTLHAELHDLGPEWQLGEVTR